MDLLKAHTVFLHLQYPTAGVFTDGLTEGSYCVTAQLSATQCSGLNSHLHKHHTGRFPNTSHSRANLGTTVHTANIVTFLNKCLLMLALRTIACKAMYDMLVSSIQKVFKKMNKYQKNISLNVQLANKSAIRHISPTNYHLLPALPKNKGYT